MCRNHRKNVIESRGKISNTRDSSAYVAKASDIEGTMGATIPPPHLCPPEPWPRLSLQSICEDLALTAPGESLVLPTPGGIPETD